MQMINNKENKMNKVTTMILALVALCNFCFGFEAVIKGSKEGLPDKTQANYELDKKEIRQVRSQGKQANMDVLPEFVPHEIEIIKDDVEWDVLRPEHNIDLSPQSRFESKFPN